MLIAWVVLVGIVIAMYIIIYKYEKKMNKMQELIAANKEKLGEHHDRITKNHERSKKNHEKLDEHNNFINQMWVTIPKRKSEKED